MKLFNAKIACHILASTWILTAIVRANKNELSAARDMDLKVYQNFGNHRNDFEVVRAILLEHKQNLELQFDEIAANTKNENIVVKATTQTPYPDEFEKMVGFKQHSEIDPAEQFIHRESPEILHINRAFKDYLYQGDLALTVSQAKKLFKTSKKRKRQSLNGDNYPEFKWEKVIAYSLEPSIDKETKEIILKALNFWENQTCLTFKENDKKLIRLKFFKGVGCWSYVGKVVENEPQGISIGNGCEHFAVVAHEIAHALGFFHAQSRHDRDKFINFKVSNVQRGYEDQFGKEEPSENNNYGVAYDYGSVLHYSDVSFAKSNQSPVLVAKEPHNQNTMGQRIAPSFSDVLVMNKHYQCLIECNNSNVCKNGGYSNPKNCTICVCPWGFGGSTCDDRQESTGKLATRDCGKTVKWENLDGAIGNFDKKMSLGHSSCHYHIKAPKGKTILIKVMHVGRVCSPGCFFGNTEFKLSDDFTKSGNRMCCPADIRGHPILTSKTNLAVISLYTRLYKQSFKLRYKYVVLNSTKTLAKQTTRTSTKKLTNTISNKISEKNYGRNIIYCPALNLVFATLILQNIYLLDFLCKFWLSYNLNFYYYYLGSLRK